MAFRATYCLAHPRKTRRKGFTLIELLVALSVLSIGGGVFVSLFYNSMVMAKSARNRVVAAALADEQLGALLRHPEQFQWEIPAQPGQAQFPVRVSAEDPPAGNPFEAPGALPAVQAADEREQEVYRQFRWQAFGRSTDAKASYYEITVAVHWEEAGRPQVLAVTSAVPRSHVPGAGGQEGSS